MMILNRYICQAGKSGTVPFFYYLRIVTFQKARVKVIVVLDAKIFYYQVGTTSGWSSSISCILPSVDVWCKVLQPLLVIVAVSDHSALSLQGTRGFLKRRFTWR